MDSMEVFGWPEFRAFAERLGIDLAKPIRSLKIDLEVQSPVIVLEEYYGIDAFYETHPEQGEGSCADVH